MSDQTTLEMPLHSSPSTHLALRRQFQRSTSVRAPGFRGSRHRIAIAGRSRSASQTSPQEHHLFRLQEPRQTHPRRGRGTRDGVRRSCRQSFHFQRRRHRRSCQHNRCCRRHRRCYRFYLFPYLSSFPYRQSRVTRHGAVSRSFRLRRVRPDAVVSNGAVGRVSRSGAIRPSASLLHRDGQSLASSLVGAATAFAHSLCPQ